MRDRNGDGRERWRFFFKNASLFYFFFFSSREEGGEMNDRERESSSCETCIDASVYVQMSQLGLHTYGSLQCVENFIKQVK